MPLRSTLEKARRSNPGWAPGDPLSRLHFPDSSLRALGSALRDAIVGCRLRGRGEDAETVGAALMFFGARTFRQQSTTFSYEILGQAMGLPDLPGELGGLCRDNMEKGLYRHFRLKVLRGHDGHRRFRATMLVHSGGTWSVLVDVVRELGRRFNLGGLAQETPATLAGLVAELARGADLLACHRTVLTSEEAQVAITEQLRLALEAREYLVHDGLVGPTPLVTLEAARRAEMDLQTLFAAPGELSVVHLLEALFPAQAGAASVPGQVHWRVEVKSGCLPFLAIELPSRLQLIDVPPDVDRIKLRCLGADDGRSVRPPWYHRAGNLFTLVEGPSVLGIPGATRPPVRIQAVFERGAEVREITVATLALLDDEVLLFDLGSGRPCGRATPGTRVALVGAAGSRIQGLPTFKPVPAIDSARPWEMWTGDLPSHPEPFTLETKHGEHPLWLATSGLGLSLAFTGDEIPDLRSGSAAPTDSFGCLASGPAPCKRLSDGGVLRRRPDSGSRGRPDAGLRDRGGARVLRRAGRGRHPPRQGQCPGA